MVTAVTIIKSDHRVRPNRVSEFIAEMLSKFPMLVEYTRPAPEMDVLFQSDYRHDPAERTCEKCD